MNDTLGGGFLDDGNGPDKILSRFICRIIAYSSPYFFDRSFDLGLVT